MRTSMMIGILLLGACDDDPGTLPSASRLWVQAAGSTEVEGSAFMVFTTADLDCDKYKRTLVEGSLNDVLLGDESAMFALGHSGSDGWAGRYTTQNQQILADGQASRTAWVRFFDPDGVMVTENSGLVLDIADETSDVVRGHVDHIWVAGGFTAENCGSYGG